MRMLPVVVAVIVIETVVNGMLAVVVRANVVRTVVRCAVVAAIVVEAGHFSRIACNKLCFSF